VKAQRRRTLVGREAGLGVAYVLGKQQHPGKALHQATQRFIIRHAVMACPTCLHKAPACMLCQLTLHTHHANLS
jgi:hypothetical protein